VAQKRLRGPLATDDRSAWPPGKPATNLQGDHKKLMRAQILSEGKAGPIAANLDEVRPITAGAVGVLPKRVHGSGLFHAGLHPGAAPAPLATPSDAQEMDDLNPVCGE